MKQGQSTTPGTSCPTLWEKCVGSLTSPVDQYREDTGDMAHGLSSLSEKDRTSNHLQMSLQRQHILLSDFKTLSVGPVCRGLNPRPPARQSGALPTELTTVYRELITYSYKYLYCAYRPICMYIDRSGWCYYSLPSLTEI